MEAEPFSKASHISQPKAANPVRKAGQEQGRLLKEPVHMPRCRKMFVIGMSEKASAKTGKEKKFPAIKQKTV